jgi:hypothetical protein
MSCLLILMSCEINMLVLTLRQLTITNIHWLKLTNGIVRFLQNMYLNDFTPGQSNGMK